MRKKLIIVDNFYQRFYLNNSASNFCEFAVSCLMQVNLSKYIFVKIQREKSTTKNYNNTIVITRIIGKVTVIFSRIYWKLLRIRAAFLKTFDNSSLLQY